MTFPFATSSPPDPLEVVWTTQDGRELAMQDISNSHLLNIIRLLQRKSLEHLSDSYSALSFIQGDMASYYAEQDIEQVSDEYLEALDTFREEARRRHIPEDQIP